MTSKRAMWILLAAIVLLVVAGGVAFYIPYQRERAALEEFERIGVRVSSSSGGFWNTDSNDYGSIAVNFGGPQWLRNRVGDRWMQPFDRVSSVGLHHRARGWHSEGWHAELPADQEPFDAEILKLVQEMRREFPQMPNESKSRILPLLLQLRSIDWLSIDDDLLSDDQLSEIRARFPDIKIYIRHGDELINREWSPPAD
ncbi:MAG: hypothetical protein WD066_09670 [Planctomycetaceae bacterium]